MEKVFGLLKETGIWFLATIDGDNPRVRPFASIAMFEGKFYFITVRTKNVSKQIAINNRIEISAMVGDSKWIRVSALAIEDPRREAKAAFLEQHPYLAEEHPIDDPDTQVLYLSNATAVIEHIDGDKETINF